MENVSAGLAEGARTSPHVFHRVWITRESLAEPDIPGGRINARSKNVRDVRIVSRVRRGSTG